MRRKTMLVLRWVAALGISLIMGGVGALVGLYTGLLMNSLFAGAVLAWLGFTTTSYLTLLMSGLALRLRVWALLLPRSR